MLFSRSCWFYLDSGLFTQVIDLDSMEKKINCGRLLVKRYLVSSFVVFVALWMLAIAVPVRAGLHYSGLIREAEDQTGLFYQSSNHNLALQLSQPLTNYLTVNEVVRYSMRSDDLHPPILETLAPSVDLLNENQLLRFNLSASSSMDLHNDDKVADNGSYEMGLKSKWQPGLVPNFQVVAGQQKSDADQVLNTFGRERNSISSTIDWARNALVMYYNYRRSEDLTPETGRVQDFESHSGNVSFVKGYWDKKLQVRIRQDFTDIEELQKIPTGSGGLVSRGVLKVRTGVDATPGDPFEAIPPLADTTIPMRDGDLLATAYGVGSPSNFNNIELTLTSQVNQIHLYTRTNLGVNPLPGLNWSLYTNDILGTNWDAATPSITGVIYNSAMQRFEISTAVLSVGYIKLVLDVSLGASAIDFTEVEVFNSRLVNTDEVVSRLTTSNTFLNLAGHLSPNWSYLARIGLAITQTDSDRNNKDENFNHGVDLKYNSNDGTFFSTVSLSSNLNVKSDRLAGNSEREAVIYSLDLDKIFLPTLSVGIGVDINEMSQDAVPVSEGHIFRLDSHARLYPDLDLSLMVVAQENESFLNFSKSSSFSGDLTLSSRLIPSLLLTWRGGVAENERGPDAVQSLKSSINMSWRLSDGLHITGGASTTQSDSTEDDPFSFNVGVDLALSGSLLLESDYRRTKDENVSQRGELSLTWFPKNGFRLESGCNYRHIPDQSGKDFTVFGTLQVNFALP